MEKYDTFIDKVVQKDGKKSLIKFEENHWSPSTGLMAKIFELFEKKTELNDFTFLHFNATVCDSLKNFLDKHPKVKFGEVTDYKRHNYTLSREDGCTLHLVLVHGCAKSDLECTILKK